MRIIIFLLFVCESTFAQVFDNDTTLSGIYNAGGKIMYISAKISGDVTITNAIIEANPFIQIFDTTVIIGTGCRIKEFSGMWYGAKSSNNDNSRQLQYAINACINKSWPLYIPSGIYKTSAPLIVSTGVSGAYTQSRIRIHGESSFWDNGTGTQISYSGDDYALGLQLNKGSEISNLVFSGGWVSPGGTDSSYYNLSLEDYTNQGVSGNGQGIWIDPDDNLSQKSGSTGCYFHDLKIEKFNTLIKISNSNTQNAEIMRFERIQFGNAKIGVQTSQPQEKGDLFDGVFSWGSIHTLFNFSSRAGNYYITNGNIAGKCIRLFYINTGSWFPTHISNFYAESLGTIGNISTNLPMGISNSVFDFAYPDKVGNMTLLSSNNTAVKFDNCQFRYYGESDNLKFSGKATFENCLFSGTVTGMSGAVFITYSNGTVNYNGSKVVEVTKVDTIQPPSVKLSIRKSYVE